MLRSWSSMLGLVMAFGIGSGCSLNPPPLNGLLASQVRPPSRTGLLQEDSLKRDVNAYLFYLDSVRIKNAKEGLTEKLKFDVLSVLAIGLGTSSAIFSFLSDKSQNKARFAGVSGAAAAFATALIAKFRHGENAAQGRTCAKLAERIIESFPYPASRAKFDSLRASIANQFDQIDCLAPELR
jgi:hypothetical protein